MPHPQGGVRMVPSTIGEPIVTRADGSPLHLRGMYGGASVFLVLSGPSLKEVPLEELSRRGVLTMGVNNSWLVHRPYLWVGVDMPGRFSDTGWRDPRILKFVPRTQAYRELRTQEAGRLVGIGKTVVNMPNVAFFKRENGFDHETFLSSDGFQWGCERNTRDSLGQTSGRSVFLVALKILYYLGFQDVYLLGCDWRMDTSMETPAYAFGESKEQGPRNSNNAMYGIVGRRLEMLQGVIVRDKVPFRIWNCNPKSHLKAFPVKMFGEAMEEAAGACEKVVPEGGWYK